MTVCMGSSVAKHIQLGAAVVQLVSISQCICPLQEKTMRTYMSAADASLRSGVWNQRPSR